MPEHFWQINHLCVILDCFALGGMISGISLEGKDLLKIPSKRRNPI